MRPKLHARLNGGGSVKETEEGRWLLEIPPGPRGIYRWAQLDDYMHLQRSKFLWLPPLRLDLRAHVSEAGLPGTWGFGWWNDPFSASFGLGGAATRIPSLPNTAWFFHGGEPNYLAFHDHHPAQGFLSSTFAAARIPPLLLAPGILAAPLLVLRPLARFLRRAARLLIEESAVRVPVEPEDWHAYRLDWHEDRVVFHVDGEEIFKTNVSPRGPLGLVLWIDNQYAAFPPSGKLKMGTSENPNPAWLELEGIEVNAL